MTDYISVAEAKTELNITDTVDDARLTTGVTAVSRVWDIICDRPAGYFVASSDTRYYDVRALTRRLFDPRDLSERWGFQTYDMGRVDRVFIDDCTEVTAVKTDDDGNGVYETTWSTSDYIVYPLNDPPFNEIRVRDLGSRSFPTGSARVAVTGSFGFADTCPEPVRQACLFLLSRFRARILSPEGLKGSSVTGMATIMETDPDIGLILASGPYRKYTRAGFHFG